MDARAASTMEAGKPPVIDKYRLSAADSEGIFPSVLGHGGKALGASIREMGEHA